MELVGIWVVEEECNDWDSGFLVGDIISEKDVCIKELGSAEEIPEQTLEIVDNLFCKSSYLES